jgi:hypothetical protein
MWCPHDDAIAKIVEEPGERLGFCESAAAFVLA